MVSAQDADRRAELALLFHAHYAELTRLAYYLTSEPAAAEDLAQETFVRAWHSWSRLRRAESAPSYLRAICVNLCRARLRRRLVERRVALPSPDVGEEKDAALGLDIAAALARLPLRKRACVVLRFYVDLTEAQTAEVLGVSVGTVKSQTAKALRLLAEHLSADERPGQATALAGEEAP